MNKEVLAQMEKGMKMPFFTPSGEHKKSSNQQ